MTVPEWVAIIIVSTLLGGLLAIFKWVLTSQDEVKTQMGGVALEMARLVGRVDAMQNVQLYQERTCADRHTQNTDALERLHTDFVSLRNGVKNGG